MKIWLLNTNPNRYESLSVRKEEDVTKLVSFYEFNGRKISDVWEPLEVAVRKKKKRSDTPYFSAGPVLSEVAVELLKDLLDDKVEILPLKFSKESYYVINVINILDCIDYNKAEYLTFSDGRVYRFTKYSFIEEKVNGNDIFKLIEHPKSEVFVSEEFRMRVLDNKLVGFEFVEVWNSEEGTEQINPVKVEKVAETNIEEPEIPIVQQVTAKVNVEFVYPELTDKEATELSEKIKRNLYTITVQYIQEASAKGIIAEIGLEYFFDGVCTDMGVRVIVLSKVVENESYELRFQLIQHPDTEYDFNHLYHHHVKENSDNEQTDRFWILIQEIVAELQEKIRNTRWESLVSIAREFSISEPEIYD